MGTRVSAIASLLAIGCTIVGCGNGDTSGNVSPTSQAAGTASASASATNVPTLDTKSAPISGVVMVSSGGGQCSVKSLDPATGTVTDFATFVLPQSSQYPDIGRCLTTPFSFAPDFKRVAAKAVQSGAPVAGWQDSEGTFTAISPQGESGDFGLPSYPGSVGFDKLGNYYYEVEYGTITSDNNWHTDYFKVPKDSTGAGELIGKRTQENKFDLGIALVPGGQLGLTPDGNAFSECSLSVVVDGPKDPDRSMYLFGQDGRVFKSREWCVNGQNAAAISPTANSAITDVLLSPDGSQGIFRLSNGKIYSIDTTGSGQPKEINAATSADLSSYSFYRWV